jgi:dipeptidase D
LWQHFEALSQIPRANGQDAAASEHLVGWAQRLGFEQCRDEAGNVLVRVPASAGLEALPSVLLQAHVDMVGVCEDGLDFDFATTPISLQLDGDWLSAKGTTLGADNGIGVAAAMAIAESGLPHGPLELLFTVEEETTMRGARELDPSMLRSRFAINLDSEEPGIIFVGSAGGAEDLLRLEVEWKPPHGAPDGDVALELEVSGLRGGHSGMEIGMRRANAIQVLQDFLWSLRAEVAYSLADFQAGTVSNAIPSKARALIVVGRSEVDEVAEFLAAARTTRAHELADDEPDFTLLMSESPKPLRVLSIASRDRFLRLLGSLPHGPRGCIAGFAGVIESSSNLAIVGIDENPPTLNLGPPEPAFFIELSSRSSRKPALRRLRAQIRACAELAGAQVSSTPPYPAWTPRERSELALLAQRCWGELGGTGQAPNRQELGHPAAVLTVVHAGLECGYLAEKCPDLDMISIGPLVLEAHTPRERVCVSSVSEFFDFLAAILAEVGSFQGA